MSRKPKVPLTALILAVLFGLACLVAAGSVVLGNSSAPDDFGLVTPARENAVAWIVVGVAAIILLTSMAFLLQEIRRRIKGMR